MSATGIASNLSSVYVSVALSSGLPDTVGEPQLMIFQQLSQNVLS
jgi:hypothetical protein